MKVFFQKYVYPIEKQLGLENARSYVCPKINRMWREEKNRLQATFLFRDFAEAFAFMTEVAIHAEKQDHHPNWSNVWNKVEIQLTTHDAGNIVTEKDRRLAKVIEAVYAKYAKHK